MQPGSKRIISGIIIFLAGALIVPIGIIVSVAMGDSNKQIFKIPGAIRYVIKKPGRYYLWNEYKIIYEGTSYNRSEDIPDGIRIKITNNQTGQLLPFVSTSSVSSDSGGSSSNSIGYVQVDKPGSVTIDVHGGNEERIFSISQFRVWKIFGTIFGGIAFSVFVCLAGGVVVVWGIIVMTRAKPPEKNLKRKRRIPKNTGADQQT